jgi:hypothetical protein
VRTLPSFSAPINRLCLCRITVTRRNRCAPSLYSITPTARESAAAASRSMYNSTPPPSSSTPLQCIIAGGDATWFIGTQSKPLSCLPANSATEDFLALCLLDCSTQRGSCCTLARAERTTVQESHVFCSCISCVKRRMRWTGRGGGSERVGCKTNKTHAQKTLPQFLQWCLRSTRLNFTRHSLHLQSRSRHQRQKKTQFTKFRPNGRKRGGKRTLRPRNRASSEWFDQFQGVPTEEQRSNFRMYNTIHTLQNTQRT